MTCIQHWLHPLSPNIGLIDSHAHLTGERLWTNVDEILVRARDQGIERVVNVCTDPLSLERGLSLTERYPWVDNIAATTPHDVEREGELFLPMVEEAAQKGRLLAIGEAGLDYHYEHAPRHLQKEYLERYFTLAILTQLPIVIHCRDAFADLFDLADRCYRDRPLLLHCFTGTKEEAQRAIDRGWKLSFSGIVTFKNSAALREVVAQVSLESILLETDAPYLAPHSRRGLVNEPAFLRETALCIAQIKGSPIEEIIAATRENSLAFFRTTA